uniref:Uncharacterized protein n=1 Tax=Phlegmariurus squarrosus TaxID=73615 RepID=H9M818_PHLSQ|nr:hypothetical protein HusqMp03 [Phlegmariurus squarrosus]AEV55725.1 hypothetical protein HusqMp03 [Phlegmariurus squarrosus]
MNRRGTSAFQLPRRVKLSSFRRRPRFFFHHAPARFTNAAGVGGGLMLRKRPSREEWLKATASVSRNYSKSSKLGTASAWRIKSVFRPFCSNSFLLESTTEKTSTCGTI